MSELRDGIPDPQTPGEALWLIAEHEPAPGYGDPGVEYLRAIARRGLRLLGSIPSEPARCSECGGKGGAFCPDCGHADWREEAL